MTFKSRLRSPRVTELHSLESLSCFQHSVVTVPYRESFLRYGSQSVNQSINPSIEWVVTPIRLEPNIAKTAGDAIQQQSRITRQTAVRQYGRLSSDRQLGFLPARRYASAGNSDRNVSVRPSVRHAPVLCQNEESQRHGFFTIWQSQDSSFLTPNFITKF